MYLLNRPGNSAHGFKTGLIRVEDYFRNTNINTYVGVPYENEACDYCWGGCPGALEEAIEILRLFDAETDHKMPPLHLVFGAYKGTIDARPGEKVIFMGNCADWQGTLAGEPVVVKRLPSTRAKKDPHYATNSDIYQKMVWVTIRLLQSKKKAICVCRDARSVSPNRCCCWQTSAAPKIRILTPGPPLTSLDPTLPFAPSTCLNSVLTRNEKVSEIN